MTINIYDNNLNRIGVLYTWISMVWEEGYNTLGTFLLEVQQTDKTMDLIRIGYYCGIGESDTLMIIKSIQTANSELIANGFPATDILTDRVSTAKIFNTNAEMAMRALVADMEPWECIELGESAGLTDIFSPQTSDHSIEEYCEIIGAECEMGFKLVRDGKSLKFVCYKPEEDPNVRYSTLYGNVSDIDYTRSDIEYKNVAIVAGAGEGDERITVMAGDTSAAGSERREMYIDARQEQPEEGESEAEYRERLVAYGEGKLIEQAKIEDIQFNITGNENLGDIVSVNIPEIGVKLKARVARITITSQNNVTTRQITVGNPVVLARR